LVRLLVSDSALIHPLIVAELACGTPPDQTSDYVSLIGPTALIDLQLLASVLVMPGAKLWTLDKRLAKLAERFGVAYQASQTAK